jgi:hypothetical protein
LASSGSFNKREKEKKRQQKHEEKERRKEERKANASGGGLDSMMAYVDENGIVSPSTPLQTPTKRQGGACLEEIEMGVPRREPEEETSPEHVPDASTSSIPRRASASSRRTARGSATSFT